MVERLGWTLTLSLKICLSLLFVSSVVCTGDISNDDPATRARSLLSQMTSAEKYSLMNGVHSFADGYYVGNTPSIPRLSIPPINMQDGPQGFRTYSSKQVGQVTSWPCALSLTASFNSTLTYLWARAMATEARAKGAHMLLGPALNFHRVARGGRNAEYLTGEDPLLGAVHSAAYVKGLQQRPNHNRHAGQQGQGEDDGFVMANIKHFVLNNQETNREKVNSIVLSNRTLWQLYYPAFDSAVQAGAASAMCSYNLINGVHACGNPRTLSHDLKQRMQFKGFVMSDWEATHATDYANAGLDQDMPGDDNFFAASSLATQIPPTQIDDAVFRILFQMIVTGIMDAPVCDPNSSGSSTPPNWPPKCDHFLYEVSAVTQAHTQLARTIATESAQLLQNDGVLPLDSLKSGSTIAVVGSVCKSDNNVLAMLLQWDLGNYYVLGGSGRVIPASVTTIADGITQRAQKQGVTVVINTSNDVSETLNFIKQTNSQVVVTCGATTSTEGHDRSSLLVDNDDFLTQLLKTAAASNLTATVPFVVLLNTPGIVLTSNWATNANAIVNMFLAGSETGHAWADLLFGDVNPSGKLPISFVVNEQDTVLPCSSLDCPYTEGLYVGYRALADKPIMFPFGHGLSYTTFDLQWHSKPSTSNCPSTLSISSAFSSSSASVSAGYGNDVLVCMSVSVSNTGERNGAEVVQLYVDFPEAAQEPPIVLKAFVKQAVGVGRSELVSLVLRARDLSIFNETRDEWQVMTGTFTAHVGTSSRNLPLVATFTLSDQSDANSVHDDEADKDRWVRENKTTLIVVVVVGVMVLMVMVGLVLRRCCRPKPLDRQAYVLMNAPASLQ